MKGKATFGVDYMVGGGFGQITIPAGASSGAVTLHALTDALKEKTQKVTMKLMPGLGYNLPRSKSAKKATVAIVDAGP
jgi:hypothetical protein